MGLKQNISVLVLLLSCLINYAQEDSTAVGQPFFVKFQDYISTRISVTNTSNSFVIGDRDEGYTFTLEPHRENYLSGSILFRSIELTYGFAPKFLQSNSSDDASLFTLNFRMYHNQWMQTIDFYNQKGFYLRDEDVKIDVPGIKTLKIGGSTAYVFNKNFSYRAIGFQNEWQLKSAGSFVPRIYYYYTKYRHKNENNNEEAKAYNISLSPAYHYNFVLNKNWLFSLGGSLGIGLSHSENLSADNITTGLYEIGGRGVISYNSNTFYGGVNANILVLDHAVSDIYKQKDQTHFLEFYIGYRFKAPKKWIKAADNFNKKLGF